MSLLIKALANAEKDKLAERDKKSADAALPLELAPKEELKLGDAIQKATQQKTEVQLSLEEEAGLGVPVVPKKLDSTPERKPLEKAPNQLNAKASDVKPPHFTRAETKPLPKLTERMAQPQTSTPVVDNNQTAAARVFVANQAAKPASSMGTLLFLGVGGALLVLLGIQGYKYFTKPAPAMAATQPVAQPATVEKSVQEVTQVEVTPENTETPQSELAQAAFENNVEAVPEKSANEKGPTNKQSKSQKLAASTLAENELPQSEGLPSKQARHAEKQNTLKLSRKSPAAGVDPTLMAAYQAFTRGEDASAQQQYRQVLQRDIRNVDALLGMAAIAQRQGRDDDAAGWYQKVLVIDPQNSIAQTALVNSPASAETANNESRIKSMLAQQPEAAHLHAALGDFYAERGQWASAQAAYFEASRFAPSNADYIFNLAVSLDQMGKQHLALAQYQRALELLNQSGGSTPDRAILEARIQALQ